MTAAFQSNGSIHLAEEPLMAESPPLPSSSSSMALPVQIIFCPGTSMVADEAEARKNIKKLTLVSGICLLFMAMELAGGMLAGSLAIMSDAIHLFSDVAGFMISLMAIFMTRRKATRKLSYGFYRAEVIGAVVSVSLVWAVTAYLVVEAVERLKHPEPIDGVMMMSVAACGLLANLLMAFMLHRGSHSDHRQENELSVGQGAPENLNIKAALIHVLGDMMQSMGVLIAAIIIYMEPKYSIADPICTFVFSVLVLGTTFKLLKEAIHVLMEGTPSHVDPMAVKEDLQKVKGVVRVHDLHIWCLSSSKATITVHVVIRFTPRTEAQPLFSLSEYSHILSECQSILCEKYHIHHSTIQMECEATEEQEERGELCSSHCYPSMCIEKEQSKPRR